MDEKEVTYSGTLQRIKALLDGETDCISIMSTVACELYHAFSYFNWVGFYRLTAPEELKVGPYQGSHGCLTISIDRGVCGACVKSRSVRLENDVSLVKEHIACSSETKAEMVLPIVTASGELVAVLDIDATETGVFDFIDVKYLQEITALVGKAWA